MSHSTASPSCDASTQISFQSSFISKQDYFYDKYSPILELFFYDKYSPILELLTQLTLHYQWEKDGRHHYCNNDKNCIWLSMDPASLIHGWCSLFLEIVSVGRGE